MPSFHNNKLKTISLDESDDQDYSPVRTSTRSTKPKLNPKTNRKSPLKQTISCTTSKPKRKRTMSIERANPERQHTSSNFNPIYSSGECAQMPGSGETHFTAGPIKFPSQSKDNSVIGSVMDPLRGIHDFNSSSSGFDGLDAMFQANGYSDTFRALGNTSTGAQEHGLAGSRVHNGCQMNEQVLSRRGKSLYGSKSKNTFDTDRLNFRDLKYGQAVSQNQFHFTDDNLRHAQANEYCNKNFYDQQDDNDNTHSDALLSQDGLYNPNYQDHQSHQDNSNIVENGSRIEIKEEMDHSDYLDSAAIADESEYEGSESEDERVSKAPKINKDGAPRKPRQPRPKLLKWSDNDWKNVALGIVWACGENGLQIPFDQAAQVVNHSCTAGALQQALLKLRGKQIAEGHQIPALKMAWTRKIKNSGSSTTTAIAKTAPEAAQARTMLPRKKPTRWEANQICIVTLRRAYKEVDRRHLEMPYQFQKLPRQRHVRIGNAIMINNNLASDVEDGSADYDDNGFMEGCKLRPTHVTHASFDLPLVPKAADVRANEVGNDMLFWTTATSADDPSYSNMQHGLPNEISQIAPLSTETSSARSFAIVPSVPGAGDPCRTYEWNGTPVRVNASSADHQPYHNGSYAQYGYSAPVNAQTPSNRSGDLYFNGANNAIARGRIRSSLYGVQGLNDTPHGPSPTSNTSFSYDESYTSSDSVSSHYDVTGLPSAASSVYGAFDGARHDVHMVSPASSSVHSRNSRAACTPVNSRSNQSLRNAPAGDGTIDRSINSSVSSSTAPVTPPHSARAERTMTDSLNPSLRHNREILPQGLRNYSHHHVSNDMDATDDDFLRELHIMNYGCGDEDRKQDIEDPFIDYEPST